MNASDIQKIVDELNAFSCMGSDLETTAKPTLSIVLVNWKTRELLKQCLKSIYKNTKRTPFEIIIVDNDSGDGSAELVRDSFPRVRLIVNSENVGHAKAMNQAVPLCKGEYVLFLNPDTIILEGALDILIDFMSVNKDAYAVTPKALGIDGSLCMGIRRRRFTPASMFFREVGLARFFPRSRIFGSHYMTCDDENSVLDVDIISGVCMLIRKRALDKIGLFDENFYLFVEDIDMSYRLRKDGGKIYYVPESTIIHYHGGSTKHRNDISKISRNEMFLLFKKHHGRLIAIYYLFLWFLTIPQKFVYYRIMKLR